jgi:uncharacterized membrane protein
MSLIKKLTQALLGIALIFTGTSHLSTSRLEFQAQVPTWLPLDPNFVVIASGIVEIILGLSLITLWKYRTQVGLTVALFFALIFPGNINQYVNQIDAFGLNTDRERLIRLLFQPLLILWALWSTESMQYFKRVSRSHK